MKKTIAMHEEKEQKHKADDGAPQNAVPAYLLERDQVCLDPGNAYWCVCLGGGVQGGGGGRGRASMPAWERPQGGGGAEWA